MSKIETTKDYYKFQFHDWNRIEINQGKIDKIKKSIQKRNLMFINPILVGKDFYIYDGQHRFKACQELDLPIHYIKEDTLSFDDVVLLNSCSSNWALSDFFNAYAEHGFKEYIEFIGFVGIHDFSLNQIFPLVLTGGRDRKECRSGKFMVTDTRKARVELFSEFRQWWKSRGFHEKYIMRNSFIRAFGQMINVEGYKQSSFLEKLENAGHKLLVKRGLLDTLRIMSDIYNYRKKDPIDFFKKIRSNDKRELLLAYKANENIGDPINPTRDIQPE